MSQSSTVHFQTPPCKSYFFKNKLLVNEQNHFSHLRCKYCPNHEVPSVHSNGATATDDLQQSVYETSFEGLEWQFIMLKLQSLQRRNVAA